jgi:hypothetical protein
MSRTTTPQTNQSSQIEVPRKSYQVYNILGRENSMSSNRSTATVDSQGSILKLIYDRTNGRRISSIRTNNIEESFEMGNAWMHPRTSDIINNDISMIRRVTLPGSLASQARNFNATKQNFTTNNQINDGINVRAFSTPPFNTDHSSILEPRSEITSGITRSHSSGANSVDFKVWASTYLFGK